DRFSDLARGSVSAQSASDAPLGLAAAALPFEEGYQGEERRERPTGVNRSRNHLAASVHKCELNSHHFIARVVLVNVPDRYISERSGIRGRFGGAGLRPAQMRRTGNAFPSRSSRKPYGTIGRALEFDRPVGIYWQANKGFLIEPDHDPSCRHCVSRKR